ncbi:MAG: transposase [Spirochaetaceae bacterium]|jgi:hypothetical protein|nr:transposase [Spirochaetaceae bacterium]
MSAYVNSADARIRMALWLAYYNSERFHSATGYLTPDDLFYGRRDVRLAERREKLHTARINRQEYWKIHCFGAAERMRCLRPADRASS